MSISCAAMIAPITVAPAASTNAMSIGPDSTMMVRKSARMSNNGMAIGTSTPAIVP
jgi:hypothetical protein